MAATRLDFSVFMRGDEAERLRLAQKLLEMLAGHGHAEIVGHGIGDELIDETFEMSRKLFEVNQAELSTFSNPPGPEPQRGWSQIGAENSATLYSKGLLQHEVPAELRDAREHFDMGSKDDRLYPNRWPRQELLPGFRRHMEGLFDNMEHVSLLIMSALELALNIAPGSFANKITHQRNASELRLNHYPPISISELDKGDTKRIWPHFDLGVITLLFQDGECGGLEFEDRAQEGHFERIECRARNEMVVNISETLQRWTNDVLPAGLHRVNVPMELAEEREDRVLPERYSIAYFCKADRATSVGPLKAFINGHKEPAYEDITAIEYHQRRLQSAY